MKQIPLTQGKFAPVDDEDFEYLNQWKWYARLTKSSNYFYAVRNVGKIPNRKTIFMHNVIMDTPKGMVCDHINKDTLNNCKSNLRNCSHSENRVNTGQRANNTSGYKGVFKTPYGWVAQLQFGGKKLPTKTYKTKEEAGKAYDEMAIKVHGAFANLNFPQDQ